MQGREGMAKGRSCFRVSGGGQVVATGMFQPWRCSMDGVSSEAKVWERGCCSQAGLSG
jgi:hypothetical protein